MSGDTEHAQLEFPTPEQRDIIAAVRAHLESQHNIDTSDLDDLEMTVRMAVLVEIVKSRQLESSQLLQVLDELSDKFLDFHGLILEMVMNAEGSRH